MTVARNCVDNAFEFVKPVHQCRNLKTNNSQNFTLVFTPRRFSVASLEHPAHPNRDNLHDKASGDTDGSRS
jgi:hypothetical protein